jgi:hypothetical protein
LLEILVNESEFIILQIEIVKLKYKKTMTREERLKKAAEEINDICKKYDVSIEDYSYGDGFDIRVTITYDLNTYSEKLKINDYGFDK